MSESPDVHTMYDTLYEKKGQKTATTVHLFSIGFIDRKLLWKHYILHSYSSKIASTTNISYPPSLLVRV